MNDYSQNEHLASGYAKYVKGVILTNLCCGTDAVPIPFSEFQHKTCVLCQATIADDPFGHNPQPLAEGVCCSLCNERVLLARRLEVAKAQLRAREKAHRAKQGK